MPHKRKDSPFWWISYTDASGRRVRESSGSVDRAEASALESRKRSQAWEEKSWGRSPDRTFEEVMVEFLRDREVSPATASRDKDSIRRLKAHFSGLAIQEISAIHVRDYIRSRKNGSIGRKAGDSTVAKELRLFSSAIRWCNVQLEWQLPNPLTGRIPADTEGRERWLSPAEARAFLAATRTQHRAPHMPDVAELTLTTAMRPSEVLRLTWNRVDLAHRLIWFASPNSKNRKVATIPLNDSAIAVLERRHAVAREWGLSPSHVIFNRQGAAIGSIKKGFKIACQRAEIEDFRPHDLRHTAASWLAQAGCSAPHIQQLLRHSDARSTSRYMHLNTDHVRGSADQLGGIFEGVG